MADMTYREWTLRLSKIVGIPDLESAPALEPNSWFLVPLGDELTSDETESLFSAVNRVLRPTYGSSFRQKVEDLETKSLLPLLYSLRLIAKDPDVRYSHFWPIVITKLFGETYDSSKFRAEIAAAQTEAWRRYRVRSNRRLYEPSPSKYVNLAWPLCHAGLIDTVKSALSDYCLDELRRGYTECKWSDERSDFEKFIEEFVLWASVRNVVANFVSNLKSVTAGSILASMAIRYLRDNWSQIANAAEATSVSRGLPTIYTYLTNDIVSVGYGKSELKEFTKSFEIILGEQVCRVPVQGGGRVIFENRTCFTLDNLKTSNRAMARLTSGGGVEVLPLRTVLPTPNRYNTMIFESESCRLQRRIQVGKKLIVSTLDGAHADEIITLINELGGTVERNVSKNGYRHATFEIPQQTRFLDEFAFAEKLDISARLDALLDVAQPTKLFSSDVSIIGGSVIGFTDSNKVVYDSNDLPILVIGGSRETYPITITANGRTGSFPEQPQQSDIRSPLILLRMTPGLSGEILVRSNDGKTKSFVASTKTVTDVLLAGEINLSVSEAASKYGQPVSQDFTVETLSKRTFSVVAWPNATLDIIVRPEYLAPYTYNRFTCDNNGHAKFVCTVDAEVTGNISVAVAYDSVIRSNEVHFKSSIYCEKSVSYVIDNDNLKMFSFSRRKYKFESSTETYLHNVIQSNCMLVDKKCPRLYIGKLNRSVSPLESLWVVYVTKRGQDYSPKKVEGVKTDEYGYFAIPIDGPNLWIMVGLSMAGQSWKLGKPIQTVEIGDVTKSLTNQQFHRCRSYIPINKPNLNEVWEAISHEPLAALVPNHVLLVCEAVKMDSFTSITSILRPRTTCRISANLLRILIAAIPVYEDYHGTEEQNRRGLSALLFSTSVSRKVKPCTELIDALRMNYSEICRLLLDGSAMTKFGSVNLPENLKVDDVSIDLTREEYVCRRCGIFISGRAERAEVNRQTLCDVRTTHGVVSGTLRIKVTRLFLSAIVMNATIFLDVFRNLEEVKYFQTKVDQCDLDQDVSEVMQILESPAEIHKLDLLRTKYKHVGTYFGVVDKILGQELTSD